MCLLLAATLTRGVATLVDDKQVNLSPGKTAKLVVSEPWSNVLLLPLLVPSRDNYTAVHFRF